MPFWSRRGARRHGNMGGRGNMGLFLLAAQIAQFGVNRIPPVTLATIAGQVAIFLEIGEVRKWFPSARNVCISVFGVWEAKQWSRLLLATVYHGSDMHLYYNMVSFLWKGSTLERKFKSLYFAYLLVVFSVLTSAMYIVINKVLAEVMDDRVYEMECAVGFSAVIFALKVLTTHYAPPGTQYVMGFIPVPSRMVYWAELVIIHFIVPNASFTGHLAGILVGLLYVKGPLKTLMDIFIPSEPSYSYRAGTSGRRGNEAGSDFRSGAGYGTGYTTGSARPSSGLFGNGTEPSSSYPGNDRPSQDQYEPYTGGLSEEEQLQQAMDESLRQRNSATNPDSTPRHDDTRPTPSAPVPEPGMEEKDTTHSNRVPPQYSEQTASQENSGNQQPKLYPNLHDLRQRRLQRYN